jgi:hypothetical protein
MNFEDRINATLAKGKIETSGTLPVTFDFDNMLKVGMIVPAPTLSTNDTVKGEMK